MPSTFKIMILIVLGLVFGVINILLVKTISLQKGVGVTKMDSVLQRNDRAESRWIPVYTGMTPSSKEIRISYYGACRRDGLLPVLSDIHHQPNKFLTDVKSKILLAPA
jgi:hypothetical protein